MERSNLSVLIPISDTGCISAGSKLSIEGPAISNSCEKVGEIKSIKTIKNR